MKTVQRRLRDLPSRVGVYFSAGTGDVPAAWDARVWAKLTAGLTDLPVPRPSEKALGDALLNGTLDFCADVGT